DRVRDPRVAHRAEEDRVERRELLGTVGGHHRALGEVALRAPVERDRLEGDALRGGHGLQARERLGDDLGADAVPRDDCDAVWSHSGWEVAPKPPSTVSVVPVTQRASSEARYTNASAMSRGSPSLPSGCIASTPARAPAGSSWPASQRSSIGVATKPGETALTRIPAAAPSRAMHFVSITTPAFAVA